MFNPLQKAKDLNEMRKQAQKIQSELDEEEIVVEEGEVKVVLTASQKVKSITISGQENEKLKSAFQKAVNRAQQIATSKLQSMTGGLGGLFGK